MTNRLAVVLSCALVLSSAGLVSAQENQVLPSDDTIALTEDTTVKLIKVQSETGSTRTYVLTNITP